MDIRKIQYFFAVIEHGNLTSAAQSLRVSQPTLSRQIQAIEEEFQTAAVRARRPRHDADRGRQAASRRPAKHRTAVAPAQDRCRRGLLEPSGEVAFGIPPSPRGLIAVPLVQAYNAAYPRIAVRIVEETSGQLRDLVANGMLDVAVTNTIEPAHGVVGATARPRAHGAGRPGRARNCRCGKETPIKALAELPLILTMRPNSLRLMIETGLGVHGLPAQCRFEANTLPLMTDLVTAGLGYTVLPACGVRDLAQAGQVSPQVPIAGSVHHLAGGPAEERGRSASRRNASTICCASSVNS